MKESTTLPYVCLRGLTLFPGNSVDLAVGRSESKNVLQACQRDYNNTLVVVTQRRLEQGENLSASDLYQVGTICRFEATVKLEDLERVRVTGIERANLSDFRQENRLQLVTTTSLNEEKFPRSDWSSKAEDILNSLEPLSAEMKESLAQIKNTLKGSDSHYIFIANCLNLIRQETKRRMNLPASSTSPFPEDEETRALINNVIAQQQRLLEEPEPVEQLKLLKELCAVGTP